MDLNGIPLFVLLQNKLGYLSDRQKMIAQNVANASTPGYTPHDLKSFADQPGIKAGPSIPPVTLTPVAGSETRTGGGSAAYMAIQTESGSSTVYKSADAPDSETTLSGNQVVLEEQMIKMSESRSEYDAAVGFYQKALSMLHMAVQKPGG